MSKYSAARKAGYSHNTAIQAKCCIEKRLNMDQCLETVGLTDKALAEFALAGLMAKKIHGTADDFIEVEDWAVRHKFWETILKLRSKLKPETLLDLSQHQHFTIELKSVADDRKRVESAPRPTRVIGSQSSV